MEEAIKKLIEASAYKARDYKFNYDVPNRPNALLMYNWLSNEIEEINTEINKLEMEHKLTSKCAKGCSACCRQCIVVSMAEVVPMEKYFNDLSASEKNELKEKVTSICNKLVEHGINENSANSCLTPDDQHNLQTQYFELEIPCLFLDNEGTCKIYKIRPTVCWKYREYKSSKKCLESWKSDTSIDFRDWELVEFNRIITARPTGKKLVILPFAIKEFMNW